MGVGLGKNSPVVLSLGKSNYEALLSRHGQWIRWRTSSKCSCVQFPSMQPDIHCPICSGFGVTYSFQKTQTQFTITPLNNDDGFLEVEPDFKDYDLLKVYDYEGNIFENAEKLGEFVYLNTDKKLVKGTYFNIVMTSNNINKLDFADCTSLGNNFYRIKGLKNKRTNIEGIYYDSPSDILSIGKIKDANNVEYSVKEIRLDQFSIEPTKDDEGEIIPIQDPIRVENVEYIKPFNFVLLNQNLSKADVQAVVEMQGDAIVIFPYSCDVAQDDILTVLAGSYVQKEVVPRSDYETDTLSSYFVYDVINCTGIINGQEFEFKEGIDFLLTGTNKIKWLSDNQPEIGEGYSISYHVLPTYKVVKEIPQLRTSENQRFPKKAVIKLFTTYAEKRGVNVQKHGQNGIYGSV